jgi:hypothetical protein
MTTIYCCYDDNTFVSTHTTLADAEACCNGRKRKEAVKTVLLNAGVPSQIVQPQNDYIFNQLLYILGIGEGEIQAVMDADTTRTVQEKVIM